MSRAFVMLVLCATACRSVDGDVTDNEGLAARGPDAGAAEAEALRPKITSFTAAAQKRTAHADEALWAHWIQGASLDLSQPDAGVALTGKSLSAIRRAIELGAGDARGLRHLESFVVGDLLAQGAADENTAVANLEASLNCTVDGKEQRYRDLNRLLVNERSAVKRRALWAACLKPAEQLDAALAKRDAKVKAVLASLEVSSPLEFDTASRELDLEVLAKIAERLLEATDDAWRSTLKDLSENGDLKLPASSLTRADLPRLLKVPPAVDAAFAKGQIAPRAVQTLASLGLYGRPGLTLELSEAAKKNPLPLTVAPAIGDVRVSFRPLGGLKDQALLLSELGTALALLSSKTGNFQTSRLGDPAIAQLSGALFASLTVEDDWLEDAGVGERTAVRYAAQVQRMFALRKAAGTVLSLLEMSDDETVARGRYVAIMTRALGVKLSAEDGVRMRIETHDFLRSATFLRSMLLASTLRARLGPKWWQKLESGQTLLALWAKGTSLPAEVLVGSLQQGLISSMPSQPGDAGVVQPFLTPLRIDAGAAATPSSARPDAGIN